MVGPLTVGEGEWLILKNYSLNVHECLYVCSLHIIKYNKNAKIKTSKIVNLFYNILYEHYNNLS